MADQDPDEEPQQNTSNDGSDFTDEFPQYHPLQPNQIPNPPVGNMHHLFRKTLTKSDIKRGLGLVGDSLAYFDGSGSEMYEALKQGYGTKLYTPNSITKIMIKYTNRNSYKFNLSGWGEAAKLNKFQQGQDIDCWAVAHQGQISLLVQQAPFDEDDLLPDDEDKD